MSTHQLPDLDSCGFGHSKQVCTVCSSFVSVHDARRPTSKESNMGDENANASPDRASEGTRMNRRDLVKRGAVLGGVVGAAWTAPVVYDSFSSPAAAATKDFPFTKNVANTYTVGVPANKAVNYLLIGGGGGGGFYKSANGGSGVKVTGTIPAQAAGYDLTIRVAAGGKAPLANSSNYYIGGLGGSGHCDGGAGGSVGNGGGGGGGSSAITSVGGLLIVAPGGGGASGGANFNDGVPGATSASVFNGGSVAGGKAGSDGLDGNGTDWVKGRAGGAGGTGGGGTGGARGNSDSGTATVGANGSSSAGGDGGNAAQTTVSAGGGGGGGRYGGGGGGGAGDDTSGGDKSQGTGGSGGTGSATAGGLSGTTGTASVADPTAYTGGGRGTPGTGPGHCGKAGSGTTAPTMYGGDGGDGYVSLALAPAQPVVP